jgi:hypothetical protein
MVRASWLLGRLPETNPMDLSKGLTAGIRRTALDRTRPDQTAPLLSSQPQLAPAETGPGGGCARAPDDRSWRSAAIVTGAGPFESWRRPQDAVP